MPLVSRLRALLRPLHRPLLGLVGILLLLPLVSDTKTPRQEAPWLEGDWPKAFATPRPALPGQASWLEATRPIPQDLRVRLHRVKDPATLMKKLLGGSQDEGLFETRLGGLDPFDVLRNAFLWSGRRTWYTVRETATPELQEMAKHRDRLGKPRTWREPPRQGHALPLTDHPDLELVAELVPTSPEGQPNAIELPAQRAGLYIVELLSEEETSYVPWIVTELALLGDQDGGQLRVTSVSARDGAPAPETTFRLQDGGQITELKASSEGAATISATPGTRRVVWASRGDSHALMAIEGVATASASQRVYAYTDRPLYKPGHEVHFKAFLRRVTKGENSAPKAAGPLSYEVVAPDGQSIHKGEVTLLNAATASYGGDFTLPEEVEPGLYRILVQALEGKAMAEFKVEHYVKPTFAVTVESPSPSVGLGTSVEFQIRAKYFHGAPITGAKARWYRYLVKPAHHSPWGDSRGPVPELQDSGELPLNAKGEASVPTFEVKAEGLYRLVASVENEAGEVNRGTAQVRCAKGDLVLLVETDRELIAPGQPFQVKARAVDLEGREVPGVPITLKACTLLRQPGLDGWAWSNQHRPGEVLAQAQGPVAQLTLPKAGLHLLVAEAKDRAGRSVEALRPITVVAEGTPLPLTDALKATADRREYALGDTARILVRLPRPNLTLRWSVENESVLERGLRKVPGTSTLVDLPLKRLHQPNVWVVFEVVAQGAHQVVEVPLRIPQVDKLLQVKVQPDQPRYQPGDTLKLALEVKDHAGRPVAADLSVGIVDEAIYALCPELHPEPFRFFYPSRRHGVVRGGSTEWSFYDLMRKARPSWTLKQTKRGEFKPDDEARKHFKDTALWVPFLATDREGRASTEVVLPDNLTSWRTTAFAMTAETQVGVGRAQSLSSKPLSVTLTLPRTLALGEESRVVALVQNQSGRPVKGQIQLEATGGTLKGAPQAPFTLADKGTWRFSLPVSATLPGTLTVKARIQGEGMRDAEVKTCPVQEVLVPASFSGSVRLEGGSRTVDVPAPPKAKGTALVVFTPVYGLETLMEPSLPSLIRYPYGCVEQTLSSFMPNVLIEDLIRRKLAPSMPWQQIKDLPKHLSEGVLRVLNYQQPNGGWGWWEPTAGDGSMNPHTTGFALQSLGHLKRLGHPLDEAAFTRAQKAGVQLFGQLATQADTGQSARAGDAAFVLLSLVTAQVPAQGLLEQSAAKVLDGRWKGTHVLAMVTLAAAETRHPRTEALMAALEKAASSTDGMTRWEGGGQDYAGGDLMPTVHAMKALCLQRPQSPLIPSGERYLASRFQGHGWVSTWTTSQTLSLLPYLAKVRPLTWNLPPMKVALQGGPTLDLGGPRPVAFSTWEQRQQAPTTYRLPSAAGLKFTASGTGSLVWTYVYRVSGAAAPLHAKAAVGLGLERKLWRLQPPSPGAKDGRGWVRQPWTGTLAKGEEAWMEVEVTGSGQYGLLEVPIPAGLEPLVKLDNLVLEGQAQGTDPKREPRIEVHPDRVCWFFPQLGQGQKRIKLWLRAQLPGTYTLRPARVHLMGDETRWATCDAMPLTVKE